MRRLLLLSVLACLHVAAKEFTPPKLPDGLEAQVLVKFPDVADTCAVAVSPDGKNVYIAQHHSANNNGKTGDIKLLTDVDGDGSYKRLTTFANDIGGGQGMLCVGDTVYCVHSPYLTMLRDTNGDGVADERKNLLEGIGPPYKGGLHDHTSSGLALATDGWLYISIGDWGVHTGKGVDGKTVQLYGGGIIRVRPDGTDVEVYCRGLRNTMDVAIDPELNVFMRDNTNDGGGWNVRSTHIWQSGSYGYPNLYINYPEEALPSIKDHGGGSPCGGLFYFENGLREEDRNKLFYCDWGRAILYRYDLQRKGATYVMKQNEWIKGPQPFRAIDIQPDAAGNLYIADWGQGGWGKATQAGAVIKINAIGHLKDTPDLPNLATLNAHKLIDLFDRPSQVTRVLAQRELIRRGAEMQQSLDAFTHCHQPISRMKRVFALWTYKQIAGKNANASLLKLAEERPDFRELALRAVTDRKGELDNVPVEPFTKALKDNDPFVRGQAAVCLGRLGKKEAGPALCEALADSELQVRHLAMQSLRTLGAFEACLNTVENGPPLAAQFALIALREIYEDGAAEGLITLSGKVVDIDRRAEVIKAIGRLARKEDTWAGNWWGTQPNTVGPFQKFTTWDASEKLTSPVKAALMDGDERIVTAGMWAARAMREKSIAQNVMRFADDARPAVRSNALKTLIVLRAPEAAPFFKKMLLNSEAKDEERKEALSALDKMKLPAAEIAIAESIAPLLAEFKDKKTDKNSGLPALALKALLNCKSTEVLPALRAVMAGTAVADARTAAAQALSANKSKEARQALIAMLKDPNPELVALALRSLDAKDAVKAEEIREFLKSPESKVQCGAMVLLGKMKDAPSANFMITHLTQQSYQASAIEALAAMGPVGTPIDMADTVERVLNLLDADEFENDKVQKMCVAAVRTWIPALPEEMRKKFDTRAIGGGVITTWHLLGPILDGYPENHDKAYEIEKAIPEQLLAFKMKAGKETLEFKPHTTTSDAGAVMLDNLYSMNGNAVAFAYAEVNSAEERKANFIFGSDDSLKVWLNGERIWNRPGDRGLNVDADHFSGTLKKGRNVLLAKICNNGGGWSFAGRVEMPSQKKIARKAQREALISDAMSRSGDAKKGELLFQEEKRAGCIRCHTVNEKGGSVGPNLSSIGATKDKRYLIDSILDPSKDLAQGFQTMKVTLKTGVPLFGVILNQTADQFDLAKSDGQREVLKEADVKDKSPVAQSVMAEGLADTLTRDEFIDLITYLQSLKK